MKRAAWPLLSVLATLSVDVPAGHAPQLRTSESYALTFGAPSARVSAARVDAAHTGHSRVALPLEAEMQWRLRLQGGVRADGLVDERGHVFLVTDEPEALELDAAGKVTWSRSLDRGPATSPVATNRGARLVLTRSGHVVGFDARGQLLFSPQPLAGEIGRLRVSPVPAATGGAVFAIAGDVSVVSDRGIVSSRTSFDAAVRWLLSDSGTHVVVLDDGRVFEWRSHQTTLLARLVPAPEQSPVLDGNQLVAVTGDRLVSLDLTSATVRQLDSRGTDPFASDPVLVAPRRVAILTRSGALLGYDVSGEVSTVEHLGGVGVSSADREGLELVVDDAGRFLAASAGGEITLLGTGTVATRQLECTGAPLLLPYAPSRLLYVCPSGQLWSLGPVASQP